MPSAASVPGAASAPIVPSMPTEIAPQSNKMAPTYDPCPTGVSMPDRPTASGASSSTSIAEKIRSSSKVSRGKKASKTKAGGRLRWTNGMVSELLRLRFADGEVKRYLDTADTKTKKSLAWQLFSSVLSQSLGVVIKQEQVQICSVSGTPEVSKTEVYVQEGEACSKQNWERCQEKDEELWNILNDAFSSRAGISGEVLMDTHVDEDNDEDGDADKSDVPPKSTQNGPPVVQLALALQTGMEAIAASMSSRTETDSPLQALATML
ncbi:hypothetical protein PI125_g12786 [Phytophthora idaei]|nr:hypothetical protein PI125_g12786 [Phytophthora idaei]